MRLLTVVIIFICTCSTALSAEIVWKVEHPFRFLRFGSDHRVHELAFEQASKLEKFKKQPVSTMEALLNDQEWWSKKIAINGSIQSPFDHIADLRELNEGQSGGGRKPLSNVSPKDLRLGWSAMLRNQNLGQPADGTCWNIRQQTYANCISEASGMDGTRDAYVMPKFHYINAYIEDAMDGECLFELQMADDGVLPKAAGILLENDKRGRIGPKAQFPCNSSPITLKLPYEPNKKKNESKFRYELRATSILDGNSIETVIHVRDFLIVALGDSFASGEGNPDVPARLDPINVQKPSFDLGRTTNEDLGFPRRKGSKTSIAKNTAAQWIDRRCHRSMYGAPTRAAIALGLVGERHHAITYLNFACSGAEITDGMLWPQDGQECIQNRTGGSFRFMEPQISGVVRSLAAGRPTIRRFGRHSDLHSKDRFRTKDLRTNARVLRNLRGYCKNWPGQWSSSFGGDPRPRLYRASFLRDIDLVFLSIGGNDGSFAPLVASATVNVDSYRPLTNRFLTKFARQLAGGVSLKEARERINNTLPDRLALLEKALTQKLEIEDIKKKVLFGAYPSVTKLENGRFCSPTDGIRENLGMSVSKIFAFNERNSADKEIDGEDAETFVQELNAKIKGSSRFNYLDDHVARFEGHAICAVNSEGSLADEFALPRKKQGSSQNNWKLEKTGVRLNPTSQFRLYAKRQRWFRTYNDAYMGVQFFKESVAGERLETSRIRLRSGAYNALRSMGGPFHPTAEGHAAVADTLVIHGMKRLGLTWREVE